MSDVIDLLVQSLTAVAPEDDRERFTIIQGRIAADLVDTDQRQRVAGTFVLQGKWLVETADEIIETILHGLM